MKQTNNQTTKRQNNLIKNFLFFFVISFLFTQTSLAQLEYWLEFNEGYDIGSITQTKQANHTIELDISNNSLENFLTDQLTNKKKYVYHLIQKDAVTDEVIGGETFEIRKKGLHQFQAQVIGPATAIKNVPVSLSATLINEDALYN